MTPTVMHGPQSGGGTCGDRGYLMSDVIWKIGR